MINKLLKITIKELNLNTVMERLLKKEFMMYWAEWLIHKWRGKTSNHKIDESKYIEAIQIIKNKYNDYWPTFV